MKKKTCIIVALIVILFIATIVCLCFYKGDKYDYLVLVNKYTRLPDDWEENVVLVDTKNAWDEDIKVEKEALKSYEKLKKYLEKEEVYIELDSAYRSVKDQQDLWDRWSADPEKGIDYVKKFVAVPGYSEHHTGLAIDICIKKDGQLIDDNDDMIAEKEIFAKIHAILAEYGFILRYPLGEESYTGYTYEPWHLRYVKSAKIAKEITEKGITLEEYLSQNKDVKENEVAARVQIVKTLGDALNDKYSGKIDNFRIKTIKVYSDDETNNELFDDYNLKDKDIVFGVTYELLPISEDKVIELTVPNGEYDETTGWVTGISRIGVLRYDEKTDTFSISHLATGF